MLIYEVFLIFFYSSSDMKIEFETKDPLQDQQQSVGLVRVNEGLYHEVWCHF